MTEGLALALTLAIPFAGAVVIGVAGRRPNLREGVTLITATALFLTVLSLVDGVFAGARPAVRLIEIIPGLPLALEIEPLGMLFGLVASGLWIVNSIYSIGYMRANDEGHQTRYYICFATAIGSAMGIAFAANMFTLFIF